MWLVKAWHYRSAALIGAAGLLAAMAAPSASAGRGARSWAASPPTSNAGTIDPLASRLLTAHNRERARLRLPLLRWDSALAASAAAYGPTLSALGGLRHSPRAARPGQGENLWMGTRSAFSLEQMVGGWASEKRQFRAGVFPNVSATGNWADVGHYSAMIWPTTTAVGCAAYRDARWDFLICRYAPAGNVDGHRVG